MQSSIVTSSHVSKSTKQHVCSEKTFSLGILPNYRPTAHSKASSTPQSQQVVDRDGVVQIKKDSSENRLGRFQRQGVASRLLPDSRTSKCLRYRTSDKVSILKSKEHNKCHYGNLMQCGSVWSCPICAAKISERRRVELKKAVDQHKASGGSVLLVTFTYSHKREDNLRDLLERQSKAMTWFYSHRSYKELKKRYMKRGRVRSLEVSHGSNGWHPHIHELWLLNLNLHDYEVLRSEVFSLWLRACARFNLGLPSEKHGVDIRGGEDAYAYVSKYGLEDKPAWGIESEVTKASSKNGRNGSRSPFQLLDDYADGDKQSAALFVEYAKAFKGKQQLVWSRGLKDQFDLETLSDEELANAKEDDAETVAYIEKDDWLIMLKRSTVKHDNRAIILHLCEVGGVDVMISYIRQEVAAYKLSH